MRRTILFAFLVLCAGAAVYLYHHGQRVVLKAQISGLTALDQGFLSEPEKLWNFLEAYHTTDDLLKNSAFSQSKKGLTLSQYGSILGLRFSAADVDDPALLDRLTEGIKLYIDSRKKVEVETVQRKVQKLQVSLYESQKELIDFQKQNNMLDSKVSFKDRERELAAALRLTKEQLKKMEQHFVVLKALGQAKRFSLRHIAVELPSARKYRALEEQYEALKSRYKDKHPKMIALRSELSALRGILFKALYQQKNILKTQQNNLETSLEGLKKDILQSAPLREKLETLEERAEQNQKAYQAITESYQQVQNKTPYEIAPAMAKSNLAAAAREAVVYFGGAFLLFLFSLWSISVFDTRIYHPKHITQVHKDFPLLAVTPKLSKREHHIPLHLHRMPSSPYSKSITLVRNRLLSKYKGQTPVLVVASASKIQGPVSTVSNLAISLAQNQKRVLLIDCQLSKPRQHHYFRLPAKGLAQVLEGQLNWEKAVSKVEIPHLNVLPAGDGLVLKALCSETFERLLQLWRGRYDFILLDAPAMSLETDSILIAQKTDGVILTVLSGRVKRQTLAWVKNEMHQTGVKLVGIILKGVPSDRAKAWNEISTPHFTA